MNGGRTGIADSLQIYENWSSRFLPFARGKSPQPQSGHEHPQTIP